MVFFANTAFDGDCVVTRKCESGWKDACVGRFEILNLYCRS